jgi:hypothetical protein
MPDQSQAPYVAADADILLPDCTAALVNGPDAYYCAISAQLNPVGLGQNVLCRELAVHLGQFDEFDRAIQSLQREGQAALLSILEDDPATAVSSTAAGSAGVALAGVLASSRHESLLRQQLAVGRAYSQTWRQWCETKRAEAPASPGIFAVDSRYASEPACIAHLARRHAHGFVPCRRCHALGRGVFIPTRLAWQCAECHSQTGIRVGTVMEKSAVPLSKWFAAIRVSLLAPEPATDRVAKFLQIDRRPTVRSMLQKINTAMSTADASYKLAGLDELYLGSC